MSKLTYLILTFTMITFVQVDFADAQAKPKKSKSRIEFEAFMKKTGSAFKAPAKRPTKKRAAKKPTTVKAPVPLPMPLYIAAQRAGMTVQEYQTHQAQLAKQAAAEGQTNVVAAEVVAEEIVRPEPQETTVAVEEVPVKVEEPKNPYLGKDCKANETDPLMCMTCIVYFETKLKSEEKAMSIANTVKQDILASGSDACYELYMDKANRFGEWVPAFPWIKAEAEVDTTMTRNEALNKAYMTAGKIMGLGPATAPVMELAADPASSSAAASN